MPTHLGEAIETDDDHGLAGAGAIGTGTGKPALWLRQIPQLCQSPW
jgi:hypothetical protein